MIIPGEVLRAAQAAHACYYPLGPYASITLAQWVIESEWGKYESGENNYFGIKATRAQIARGEARACWTHETINGVYEKEIQWFANYPTIEAGFMAHAELLAQSRYYFKAQQATTPDDYAMALQGVYATGIPGHPYGEALIDIMKQNNLYQYDTPISSVPQPAPGGTGQAQSITKESPTMFSFLNLFSMLQAAPAIVGEATTVATALVSDIETIATSPEAKALEAFINANFTHVSTPGAASVLEPKVK